MRTVSFFAVFLSAAVLCNAANDNVLAQHPTLSKTQIVFCYAD